MSRIPMISVRKGVLEGLRIMGGHQLREVAVLKSHEWRSGTIRDRQDATVRLIRSDGIPRTMFWHASSSSNGCLPTRQFPQWKWTLA
eukprot:1808829-Pyramimonas_sp.AAC.1